MAAADDKSKDFYAILGLEKECSSTELRNAYKKLAMKWHPDRFFASGNSKHGEEAKKKFQAIQQAYSVLSDANKRFLYDVGVYDCNDDADENGMGEFLDEMAEIMTRTKSNGNETFEELQHLFNEMFQDDLEALGHSSSSSSSIACSSSSPSSCSDNSNYYNFDTNFQGFCMGRNETSINYQNAESSHRRSNTRKGRR